MHRAKCACLWGQRPRKMPRKPQSRPLEVVVVSIPGPAATLHFLLATTCSPRNNGKSAWRTLQGQGRGAGFGVLCWGWKQEETRLHSYLHPLTPHQLPPTACPHSAWIPDSPPDLSRSWQAVASGSRTGGSMHFFCTHGVLEIATGVDYIKGKLWQESDWGTRKERPYDFSCLWLMCVWADRSMLQRISAYPTLVNKPQSPNCKPKRLYNLGSLYLAGCSLLTKKRHPQSYWIFLFPKTLSQGLHSQYSVANAKRTQLIN